jgi:hypothetical protein
MVFQNDILAGASGAGVGYQINQSIRFNDNDSAYLSRTSGATGDRQKWTFSTWIKRGNLSSNQRLFHDSGNTNFIMFGYSSNNEFRVYLGADIRTTALFRDPSAWYHLVVAVDTTQATSSDRVKIYQNGVQITSFSAAGYPSLNYNTIFNNSGTTYQISGQSVAEYFDGYISEFHWIDGQALAPTDFGETNDDGVWIPKAYAGTYGTNGFYITGADSADLGADYSGNGNDFTSSGLTSDDQVTDTPTENYATWNVLDKGSVTAADGNLTMTSNVGQLGGIRSTIPIPQTGKYYWEMTVNSLGYITQIGLATASKNILQINDGGATVSNRGWEFGSWFSSFNGGVTQYASDGGGGTGTNWTGVGNPAATDVLMIAYDSDNGSLWFGKNGTWFNSSGTANPATNTDPRFSGLNDGSEWFPVWSSYNTSSPNHTANFGQSGFTYTPPTGFSALSTANLPAPTIKDGSTNFNVVLYTGTGNVTRSVTGVGFQPDLVYNKQRNNTSANVIANAVSGANTFMATDQTTAESSFTNSIYGYLSSFDSDGYTLTPGSTNNNYWNENAINFVSYNWLAGNGTASNTDGSITSTVSVNTTAGFSVLTFAGSGGTGTVGHGLSQSPNFIIVKSRDTSNAWYTGSDFYTTWEYYQTLNSTAAQAAGSTVWNSTAPTSSVFSIGASLNTSAEDYVAYCWHSVEGFSKFGSYTGNGSADGPFVWCGFRPVFILVKEYTSADDWLVYDAARDPYNVAGQVWRPDSSAAEFDGRGGSRDVDFLSNGFKFRSSNATMNGNGAGYIFMAFAEHPFGGDGVAPVPAR